MSTDKAPLDINGRLYKQVGALLTNLERGDDKSLVPRIEKHLANKKATLESLKDAIAQELIAEIGVTMRERIAALVAIGRLQVLFGNLGKADEPESGGKVKQYARAFRAKTNAPRQQAYGSGGRATSSGSTVVPIAGVDPFPDDDDDPDTAA